MLDRKHWATLSLDDKSLQKLEKVMKPPDVGQRESLFKYVCCCRVVRQTNHPHANDNHDLVR